MLDVVLRAFDTTGFVPRSQCGEWPAGLRWLHVGSDLFIWLAYVSIPLVLLYFVRRRRDLPFSGLFVLFALFILACGFTHFIDALMFDYPVYRLAGLVKLLTAVVSWATVIALVPIVPRALDLAAAMARTQTETTVHRPVRAERDSRTRDYIAAILAGVLALLVRAALDPLLRADHAFVVSLLAVVFVSWQYGFGPGIVTLLVSMAGFVYFFVGRGSFVVGRLESQLAVALFFFCGVACAALGEAQRAAQRRAQDALDEALAQRAELEAEVARRQAVEFALRQRETDLLDLNAQFARSQRAATEALAQLDTFVMNAPVGIAFYDTDLRYVRVNTYMAAANRAPAEAHGGRTTREVIPHFPEELLADIRGGLAPAAAPVARTLTLPTAAGEPDVTWQVIVFPVRGPAGDPLGVGVIAQDVTARRRAEDALRESEAKFRLMAESIPQLAWMARADGHIFWYNRQWYDYTGTTPEQMEGWGWRSVHDPDALPAVLERWKRSIATGEPFDMVFPLKGADGRFRPFLTRINPLRDAAGRVELWFGTNTDISAQKAAEESLREQSQLAALRAEVALALGSNEPAAAVLRRCTGALVHHLGAAFARVWTTDDAGEVLELQASSGLYTHTDGPHARVPVGEYKIGRIARDRRPHLTNDVLTDPHVSDPEWARREGMVAFAGYPLVVEGRLRGVMALFARQPLSPAALADLAPLAEAVGQYLERKRAEEATRASAERFRTLTEAIPQMVWNADAGGRVSYFNTRWREYTGQVTAAAADEWWPRVLHPDDADRVVAAWRSAVAEDAGPFAHEARVRRWTDGSYRWFLTSVVPVRRADGRVDQWVGTMTDIDDQKRHADRLEQVVRERTAELVATNAELRDEVEERRRAEDLVQATAKELRRSNAELEKFAYVASHDLQEPLRKIQAFGDRLRNKFRQELPEGGREYVDRMLGSAGRMRRLIDDLLTFSRVTSKARPFEAVDLGAVVGDVLGDLEVRLEQTGGTVDVGPLPAIDADPSQIRQLFQNLIGNALKFHRPGVPPTVRVHGEIVPADPDTPLTCRLSVQDNGIGFDEKYRDRIFDVFQRLHGRDEYEGTGVGLAICRKIVERHGGSIAAHSTPGEGATFVVTLPVRQPREDAESDGTRGQADHDSDGR